MSLIFHFPQKHCRGHVHQNSGMWSPCLSLSCFYILNVESRILSFSLTFFCAKCETVRAILGIRTKLLSLALALSLWVGGCAVCGVTIARSNVSRMNPNHKMLSSQHVSPPGQGEISEPLIENMGLVSLKNRWLGNTWTVRIMNVPLFNTFLCCRMSQRMSVRTPRLLIFISYWFTVCKLFIYAKSNECLVEKKPFDA